jgi:hypothetical protein
MDMNQLAKQGAERLVCLYGAHQPGEYAAYTGETGNIHQNSDRQGQTFLVDIEAFRRHEIGRDPGAGADAAIGAKIYQTPQRRISNRKTFFFLPVPEAIELGEKQAYFIHERATGIAVGTQLNDVPDDLLRLL